MKNHQLLWVRNTPVVCSPRTHKTLTEVLERIEELDASLDDLNAKVAQAQRLVLRLHYVSLWHARRGRSKHQEPQPKKPRTGNGRIWTLARVLD